MADYVKKRTHIINHEKFLAAGPHARDLYDWGMLLSGQQETDGELSMVVVLASPWGYGGKANIRAAQKLVEVGLWERTDRGFRILKWAEQGNVTKAELTEKRRFDRDRKARQRKGLSEPCPTGTPTGTPVEFPSSTFNSSSSGSSSLEEIKIPEGNPSARETLVPEWFVASAGTASMAGPPIEATPARWLTYKSSRSRKGWAMNHEDAVGWLCEVAQSDHEKRMQRPQRADTRQPLRDREHAEKTWLNKTGTDL